MAIALGCAVARQSQTHRGTGSSASNPKAMVKAHGVYQQTRTWGRLLPDRRRYLPSPHQALPTIAEGSGEVTGGRHGRQQVP
jgi:hypothetical protein